MKVAFVSILSLRIPIILALCVIVASCATVRESHQRKVSDLVELSTFIFEGTIKEFNAVTVSKIPASPHTSVVKVNKVLNGPKFFSQYTGNLVTVLLKDLSNLKIGSQVVFFANGWLVSSSIAVSEVGRLERYNIVDLRKQIAIASDLHALQPIKKVIGEAELVLVGKVSATRDLTAKRKRLVLSEHDPQWQEATIEIKTVLKGAKDLKKVKFVFPGSIDVAWYDVPKFKVGQEGIWILKKDPKLKAYAIKTRFGFQTRNWIDQIRKLIMNQQ